MKIKLLTVLILIGLVQVNAKAYAQKITLNLTNAPVEKVLQAIKEQSGYVFFYNKSDILQHKVSVSIQKADIKSVLDLCFQKLPLTYIIEQRTIVISLKKENTRPLPADTVRIHGRVTDKNGKPLVGASVLIKQYKIETSTNANGEFYLGPFSDKNVNIHITYVGFTPKDVMANANLENIIMEARASQLDETRIIGYGSESRRFSVGSTVQLSAQAIERQPITNVLLALQGQVPGLEVNPTSGVPGSQIKLQIRGQNSLRNSISNSNFYDQPLFIIDGIPFAPQNQNVSLNGYLFNSNIQPSGYSALNSLNPNDIESISVLKDADATSIYGSQGANGVVLITTKRGKSEKTTLNVSVNSGYNFVTRPLELLNTEQYLQIRKEAFKNDGLTPTTANPFSSTFSPDLLVYDQNKYTDFNKLIRGKNTKQTDAHASLTGGNGDNNFIVSVGYITSNYNFPGDYADQKYTIHTGFHHSSPNRRLSIDIGNDYFYNRNNSVANNIANSSILLPPNMPDLLNADGGLVWNYKGIKLGNAQFFGFLKQPSLMNLYNLNNSIRISYKLLTGLSISSAMGYNQVRTAESSSIPALSQDPSRSPTSNATFANNTYQSINIEPQLNYEKNLGKGMLTVLLGGTYRKNMNNNVYTQGFNYSSDYLLGAIDGAATVRSSNSSGVYKYVSGFARIRYVYDQKYIVSLTGRRDGSSNFGPNRQFGNFGSVGAGWIFSEENAFKSKIPVISYGKISVNYGTNGSDGISPYLYQPFWKPDQFTPSFQGIKPILPVNPYQPDFSWAVKKSLNLSLDFGFFHDQLLLNANYYLNQEGNQLLNYQSPGQTGFSSVVANLNAKVQNKGLEFMLTSNNTLSPVFKWTTNFNISFNRNKLLSYPNLSSSTFANQYIVGKSTSIVQLYHYKGVNQSTGIFEYYGANGEVTSEPNYGSAARNGDFTTSVDLAPKYSGGLGNNITYKRLNLYFFLQFSKQTTMNYMSYLYDSAVPGKMFNLPTQVLGNYWQKPGDNKPLQRLTASSDSEADVAASSFSLSDGAYSDNTYIRLKTISLAYNFPDHYLKKLGVTNGKLFVNAQNLLTITNYKVGDPEQPGNLVGFPLQRTMVLGLSFNL